MINDRGLALRRALMEDLATRYAERPSSSDTPLPPMSVTDSRIEPDGSIRLSGPDAGTVGLFRELLAAREDISMVDSPGQLHRYSFGVPGYLNNMSFENLQRLLERSNPELPQGSLRVISGDNGGRAPRLLRRPRMKDTPTW